MSNLGRTHFLSDESEQALPILEEALALSRVHLGEEHPTTLMTMALLAGSYRDTSSHAAAQRLYVEVMNGRRRVLGAGSCITSY